MLMYQQYCNLTSNLLILIWLICSDTRFFSLELRLKKKNKIIHQYKFNQIKIKIFEARLQYLITIIDIYLLLFKITTLYTLLLLNIWAQYNLIFFLRFWTIKSFVHLFRVLKILWIV